MNKERLIKELIESGAEVSEAKDLANFGSSLQGTVFQRSLQFKSHQADILLAKTPAKQKFDLRKLLAPIGLALASLSVVTASAFAAQSSIPGDPLYPIKRLSEKVFQTIDPQFKNEIPVRRSQELKDLIEKKQNESLIKKSIEDYKQTESVKSETDSSKKAQENLRQAEEKATGDSKLEINKIIEQGKVQGETIKGSEKKNIAPQKPTENSNNRSNTSGENKPQSD